MPHRGIHVRAIPPLPGLLFRSHISQTAAIFFTHFPPHEHLLLCSAWEHTHPVVSRGTDHSHPDSLSSSTEHDTEFRDCVGMRPGSAKEVAGTLETATGNQEDDRDETMGFSLGAAAQGHLLGVSWCAQTFSSF